jgi:methionyl aminopeptidase
VDSPLQQILETLAAATTEGQTGKNLDVLAADLIRMRGCKPAFLGYKPEGFDGPEGYPATLCVSVNGEVIHGIPNDTPFKWGDVISLDLGLKKTVTTERGVIVDEYDDGALTVALYGCPATARRLIKATKEALDAGCLAAKHGKTVFDISRAIKAVADRENFAVVQGYGGHGIGVRLHLPPHIPNEPIGEDAPLEPGMRLAIEPMFSTTKGFTKIDPNGWTVKLTGGGIAAHFERTVTV